jgi:hypothetical protein
MHIRELEITKRKESRRRRAEICPISSTTSVNNSINAITFLDDKTSLDLPSAAVIASKPLNTTNQRAEQYTKAAKNNDVDRLSNWAESVTKDLEVIQQELADLLRISEQLEQSLVLLPQCCQAFCRCCHKYAYEWWCMYYNHTSLLQRLYALYSRIRCSRIKMRLDMKARPRISSFIKITNFELTLAHARF